MIQLTEKDVDIFRILSSGATAYMDIETLLERSYRYTIIRGRKGDNETGKHKKRGFQGSNSKETTRKGLKNRISELKAEGFILSRVYPRRDGPGIFALYVLTPLSMAVLIEHGYDSSWIRMNLPGNYSIAHDKMVTETVRAIKREGGRVGYNYAIIDEVRLKEMHGKSKADAIFPDLFARITLDVGSEEIIKRYHIEIDNNTLRPEVIVEKVRKAAIKNIILCTIMSRIESLRRAFIGAIDEERRGRRQDKKTHEDQGLKNLSLDKKVIFALVNDFHRGGFLGTNFITLNNEPVYIIDPDLKKRIVIKTME